MTINVSSYSPQHPVHQAIRRDYDANKPGSWRLETEQQVLADIKADDAKNGFEADADGVVTLTGESVDFTEDKFQAGHAFYVGTTFYIVTKIDVNGSTAAVTIVNADGTALSAAINKVTAGYKVVNPALRWSFSGQGKNILSLIHI